MSFIVGVRYFVAVLISSPARALHPPASRSGTPDMLANAAAAAAARLERLRSDPAVFLAELPALINTTVEGLEAVVDGAHCHHADPRVQAAVLVALKKLIAGAGDWVKDNGQTVNSNKGKLFELGALEAALAAMSAHAAERAVQAAACGMLSSLVNPSPHATAICAKFAELGGIARVMGALDAFPRERGLVKDAVGALKCLMIGDEARTAIIAMGGMERAIIAMDNHPDGGIGVRYEAVSALDTMSQAGPVARQRLAALGAAARVRSAMAAPDVHARTTEYGQKLLARLPAGDLAQQGAAVFLSELPALITTVEGLEAVVDGARCHHADPRVQAAVLVALKKLIAGGGDWVRDNGQTVNSNIGKLFELGALEAALAAMSAHAAERAVQAAACGMLSSLVNPSPHATAICAKFAELGGIARVMGALDAFPRERGLVKDAVGALKCLMIGDEARTAIIAMGGMERAIIAMDNHPDGGIGVRYEAVSALDTMSQAGPVARQRLAALGAAARVRSAMAAPDVHARTTEYGQKLLARLPAGDLAQQGAAAAASAGAASIEAAHAVTAEAMLLRLAEMGFPDGIANKELLEELNFDMAAVIERLTINAQTSDSPVPSTQQPQEQQLRSRLSDLEDEPLGVLSPVTGIGATPPQPLMAAAMASGVADMDAHGFVAAEHGAALAREDPHGLTGDEAGALTLYTCDSEMYKSLNHLLRQRDRQRLRPFFPYLRLMLDARRKLPRHVGVVWRGVRGVDLSAKYQKGSEVYWWAFSSATKELSTLQNPNFLGTSGVRTVFNIQVKRGVDIVRYSIFQGEEAEAEVLIFPGTKLRVVDSMNMGSGLFMVHLEEIEIPTELLK